MDFIEVNDPYDKEMKSIGSTNEIASKQGLSKTRLETS